MNVLKWLILCEFHMIFCFCVSTGKRVFLVFWVFFFFFLFFVLHSWHMEVPRLGVESELQMLAYTTATATPDPSCVCHLHHSSWQCQILNQLIRCANSKTVFLIHGAKSDGNKNESSPLSHTIYKNEY